MPTDPTNAPSRYITVEEFAQMMRIQRRAANELCHRRGFPARKMGKSWRIDTHQLDRYFAEGEPR